MPTGSRVHMQLVVLCTPSFLLDFSILTQNLVVPRVTHTESAPERIYEEPRRVGSSLEGVRMCLS